MTNWWKKYVLRKHVVRGELVESEKEYAIGIVRSALGAIPMVGTGLNELFFDTRTRIKQKRLEILVGDLEARIKALEDRSTNFLNVSSDEFSDIYEVLIRESTRRKMHKNLGILVDLTVECLSNKDLLDHPLISVYIESIASLSEQELKIVQHLRRYDVRNRLHKKNNSGQPLEFKLRFSDDKAFDLDKDTVLLCIDSLISKGLVIDDSVNRYSTSPRSYITTSNMLSQLFEILDTIENKDSPE